MSGHLIFRYKAPNWMSLNWNRAKLRPASPNHHARYAL